MKEIATAFRQTNSITRRLKGAFFATTFFFILGFAGLYLSSQTILERLTDLQKKNQAYDMTRQISQLIGVLSENLRVAPESSDRNLPTFFSVASEKQDALFSQATAITEYEPQLHRQFVEVRETVRSFNESAKRVLLNIGDRKQEQLMTKQFEVEALEQLTKIQIALKSASDQVFDEIYAKRFQPLIAGVIYTALFAAFSLFMGLGLTRRISASITNLLDATARVGAGDLAVRAPIIHPDEIGSLTHSFNQMIENVRSTTVSKDSLERANKELEAFSYSVSHDLRAPLRGIDGFSMALIEDLGPQLTGDMKDYLQRIRAGVQKMGKLIDDMLNLSKMSRKELVVKSVDVSSAVARVVESLLAYEPERKHEVTIAPGLEANVDPDLLMALLENLIGNAWKYSSKKEMTKIEFGLVNRNGKNAFYVKDNGAGFDMAYYSKLFGAFQRLHSANDFPGTGVGLAIVQRIVRRHGGIVWAESAVDHGSTFYFTMSESA